MDLGWGPGGTPTPGGPKKSGGSFKEACCQLRFTEVLTPLGTFLPPGNKWRERWNSRTKELWNEGIMEQQKCFMMEQRNDNGIMQVYMYCTLP